MNDELKHYGVKGMKWGVRKSINKFNNAAVRKIHEYQKNEIAYRDKLSKISKSRYARPSDKRRANYRKQDFPTRARKELVGVATRAAAIMAIQYYMSGGKNKPNFKQTGKDLAIASAYLIAKNDILAKSASKKYNDDGTRNKTEAAKKLGPFKDTPWLGTREDKMEKAMNFGYMYGENVAKIAYQGINKALYMSFGSPRSRRAANEAKFRKMGGNILQEKFDNVVYREGNMEVIDNVHTYHEKYKTNYGPTKK